MSVPCFFWFHVSLQEVNATPVRFISDLMAEDSWSHALMDTLAPRGFVKVRQDRDKGGIPAAWILETEGMCVT